MNIALQGSVRVSVPWILYARWRRMWVAVEAELETLKIGFLSGQSCSMNILSLLLNVMCCRSLSLAQCVYWLRPCRPPPPFFCVSFTRGHNPAGPERGVRVCTRRPNSIPRPAKHAWSKEMLAWNFIWLITMALCAFACACACMCVRERERWWVKTTWG